MHRTRIIADADQPNYAEVHFASDDGSTDEVRYFAPSGGGYVRTLADHRQVCRRLRGLGPTLEWDGKGALADLLRREWRSHQAAKRREAQRYGRA